MDALALLCTLHADGPATLKRLRARGYSDLVTLIQRSSSDLSADLDVEPAFARRLLREAKLLAVRVGAEGLEAEEAPPIVTSTEPDADVASADAVPRSIPIAAPAAGEMSSELSESDRSLVERIVAAPKMEAQEEPSLEGLVPDAAAELSVDVPVEVPIPTSVEPEPEPVVTEDEPVEVGSLEAAALPGLDADLIFDLKASGITTLEQLAQADSLQLTRALGVTFAQARRLGFLARRSVVSSHDSSDGAQPEEPKRKRTSRREAPKAPVALPEVTLAPHRRPAPKVEAEAAPASVSKPKRQALTAALAPLTKSDARPVTESPADSPADSSAESPAESPAEPTPKPAEEPRAAKEERKPFWEPRGFLTDSVEPEEAPGQGVKVDPSEIAPRPRFGDRLAQAAEQERKRAKAEPTQSSAGSPGQTVLGWNFEIPRPEDEPSLPLGSLSVPPDEESEPSHEVPSQSVLGDQDRGGPFA